MSSSWGITIQRLTHQLLENHLDLENTVLIGIQPRGIYFSNRIVGQLKTEVKPERIHYGKLDTLFTGTMSGRVCMS